MPAFSHTTGGNHTAIHGFWSHHHNHTHNHTNAALHHYVQPHGPRISAREENQNHSNSPADPNFGTTIPNHKATDTGIIIGIIVAIIVACLAVAYFFTWLKRTFPNESNTSSKARAMNKKHGRNWGYNYDPDTKTEAGFHSLEHLPQRPPKPLTREEQEYFKGFDDVALGPPTIKPSVSSTVWYGSQVNRGSPKISQGSFFPQELTSSEKASRSRFKGSRFPSRSVSPGPRHSSSYVPSPWATREFAHFVSGGLSHSSSQGCASRSTFRGPLPADFCGSPHSASQEHIWSTSQGLSRSATVGHSGTPSCSSSEGRSFFTARGPSRSASLGHCSSEK